MKEDLTIPELCTTDCIHVQQGTCPFTWSEKYEKCPIYINWKRSNEEQPTNEKMED